MHVAGRIAFEFFETGGIRPSHQVIFFYKNLTSIHLSKPHHSIQTWQNNRLILYKMHYLLYNFTPFLSLLISVQFTPLKLLRYRGSSGAFLIFIEIVVFGFVLFYIFKESWIMHLDGYQKYFGHKWYVRITIDSLYNLCGGITIKCFLFGVILVLFKVVSHC